MRDARNGFKPTMTTRSMAFIVALCTVAACSEPLFPPTAVKDISEDATEIFDPEADVYLKGSLIRVGGRMIMIKRQDGFFIVAEELPIHQDPRQGPIENVHSTGWFAFFYGGDIDELGLQPGNKFILIGRSQGTELVTIGGVTRPMPYLLARCLHVWKTGRDAISDFPNLPAGYYPLTQETYCLATSSEARRS